MRYRCFPGGGTVIDRFLRSRENLDRADRQVLLRRRDPVDCIFEVVRIEDEGSILLNLIDDLEYRVHSNTGQTMADLGGQRRLCQHTPGASRGRLCASRAWRAPTAATQLRCSRGLPWN